VKVVMRLRLLESGYRVTESFFKRMEPIFMRLGYQRADRFVGPLERLFKGVVFDCRMCGQCVLHSTGMTCPMTCPKSIRNGPCGGVRTNGHCEVEPDRRCVWLDAYERSLHMLRFGGEMKNIQPPLDRRLEGTSAWLNWLRSGFATTTTDKAPVR
jgi:hypothetical protein